MTLQSGAAGAPPSAAGFWVLSPAEQEERRATPQAAAERRVLRPGSDCTAETLELIEQAGR